MVTAGAFLPSGVRAAPAPAPPGKMIGIQVGAASFLDEGTDQVLDILQERTIQERQHRGGPGGGVREGFYRGGGGAQRRTGL